MTKARSIRFDRLSDLLVQWLPRLLDSLKLNVWPEPRVGSSHYPSPHEALLAPEPCPAHDPMNGHPRLRPHELLIIEPMSLAGER